MKGIAILRNEGNNKVILQVDIGVAAKNPTMLEDIMDIVIAMARKDEKNISWKKIKEKLKKPGRV